MQNLTPQETANIGVAYTFAKCGWWNDCFDALTLCPRTLFERVEARCASPRAQNAWMQERTIRAWAAENGLVLNTNRATNPTWTIGE